MGKFSNLAKSIYNFLSPIAPAFLENSVPAGTPFPYITYSLNSEDWFNEGLMQVRIWTKSSSLVQVSDLTDKLEDIIGNGIAVKLVGGGTIYIYKGSPFAQFVSDDDISIKTVYINLNYKLYQ